MSQVTMKQLLEAGVHFGHQTSRWNPKMRPFIFGARNGIHIIDLQQTVSMFRDACSFLRSVAADGGSVLFVGTKKQAQEPLQGEAERSGQAYVNARWLGGTLTNFQTIKKSIERLKKLEESLADSESIAGLKKKERLMMSRECDKLRGNLQGLRDMKKLPDALFIIDPDREAIAVNEANRLGIPVVAVVDTNCDPDRIAYCIPGNDDAIRAIRLFCSAASEAILSGQRDFDERNRAQADAVGLELGMGASSALPQTPAGETAAAPEAGGDEAKDTGETAATADVKTDVKTAEDSSGPAAAQAGEAAPVEETTPPDQTLSTGTPK